MQTLLIGEGPSADHWLSALTVCPQTVLAGFVTSAPGNGPVSRFETIGSAFKAVTVEFTVCAGAIAAAQVLEVLERGVPVLIAGIDGFSATDLRAIHAVATAGERPVFLPRGTAYARCEKVLRGFLGSGRLGR
ncbi:MAG: hypothetical protein IPF49_07405 [Gammaproteobacteria bacterium]|nr:hypothetical protein [Gammaproteobacteria bacterium]